MDSGNKLFLLDAYALIYRAYYAFIKNPRINSKGFNTSAILGFVNTLVSPATPAGTLRLADYRARCRGNVYAVYLYLASAQYADPRFIAVYYRDAGADWRRPGGLRGEYERLRLRNHSYPRRGQQRGNLLSAAP